MMIVPYMLSEMIFTFEAGVAPIPLAVLARPTDSTQGVLDIVTDE
jgi:hypothetical protein